MSLFQQQLSHLAPGSTDLSTLSAYSPQQLDEYRTVFYSHSDGKPHINEAQLAGLLNSVINTGYKVSPEETALFLKKMDTDKDGVISFEDFVLGLRHLSWIVGNVEESSTPPSKFDRNTVIVACVATAVLTASVCLAAIKMRLFK